LLSTAINHDREGNERKIFFLLLNNKISITIIVIRSPFLCRRQADLCNCNSSFTIYYSRLSHMKICLTFWRFRPQTTDRPRKKEEDLHKKKPEESKRWWFWANQKQKMIDQKKTINVCTWNLCLRLQYKIKYVEEILIKGILLTWQYF
jgi:hypothetical protein